MAVPSTNTFRDTALDAVLVTRDALTSVQVNPYGILNVLTSPVDRFPISEEHANIKLSKMVVASRVASLVSCAAISVLVVAISMPRVCWV